MTLQRFQNFQIGALDAARLNQMVDTIMRLERAVAQMQRPYEPTKDVILAQVTGDGVKSDTEGSGCIPCVSYPFAEVGLAIATEGSISGKTCVSTKQIEGGLNSARGAHLIMLEDEPTLKRDQVVKAHLASRASSGTAEDKGMVYIGTPIVPLASQVQLATVVSGANALYDCTLVEGGDVIQAYNLYETNGYYGALQAQVECARLSVFQPIQPGRTIWVFQPIMDGEPAETWVTMTPIAFNSECTCNTGVVQQLNQAEQDAMIASDGKGGVAASIVSRIMGI